MKRIYLLMLLAIGVVANSFGQTRTPDFSILHRLGKTSTTVTFVKDNDRIIWDGADGPTAPVKYYANWWVINNGATANDSMQQGDSLVIFSPWNTRYIGTTVNMGAKDTSSISPNPNNPVQFKPNDTVVSRAMTVEWCDSVAVVTGPGSATPMMETNKTNNTICHTVTLDIWAVGIPNISGIEGNGLAVYPNPATGKLNFAYDFGTNANGSVAIVDMVGKTVYFQELTGMTGLQQLPIGITNLAPGMYILKVTANEKVATERFNIK